MKIVLGIENIELGYLTEHNGKFMFAANTDEIVKAIEVYPLEMMLFKLNSKGIEIYDSIPYPFRVFLAGTGRRDIIEKAGIEESDSDFVKLYKVAGIDLVREHFDIHRG